MITRRIAIGALFIFLFPAFVSAASQGAGFAAQSIFLSRTPVTEGESVLVYASVTNPSGDSFQGTLVFKDTSREIGSVSVSLSSGEARLVSISWTPAAGSHLVTAELRDGSGKVVATESETFTVAPKLASAAIPDSNNLAQVESSASIGERITTLSPQAGAAAQPVLSALDSARVAAANILDSQIAQTKPKLPGMVLGAETKKAAQGGWLQNIVGWLLAVFWTLYFYLLTILRSIVGSVAFFYPIFVFLSIYLLFKLYRKMSGPRY